MSNPQYPACKTMRQKIIKKGWTCDKVAMLLRVRFDRAKVRIDGRMKAIDSKYLVKASKGLVPVPDTLRAQVAKIVGLPQKEVFPEYAIAAETFKRERESRGLTQRDIAEYCQEKGRRIRDTEISAIECGSKFAHEGTRQLLAEIFKMREPKLFPEYQFQELDVLDGPEEGRQDECAQPLALEPSS